MRAGGLLAGAAVAVGVTVAAPVVHVAADPGHTNEFRTPSRNITCLLSAGGDPEYNYVRCEIAQIAYPAPPLLPDCGSFSRSMGHMVFMYEGRPPGFECPHDSISPDVDVPVLAYGQSVRVGNFTCESTDHGVNCTDATSVHRFWLSRDGYYFT
ncbi:MAG: DUF6636 domain-containing protein [Mycobacterium sp.]